NKHRREPDRIQKIRKKHPDNQNINTPHTLKNPKKQNKYRHQPKHNTIHPKHQENDAGYQ
ncbi:MAG TPA: hypothetical protein O0Y16_03455, partial [Methanocorpusculum sp.]|nr:hypothetical protein [Methanocorpusculum sp.]